MTKQERLVRWCGLLWQLAVNLACTGCQNPFLHRLLNERNIHPNPNVESNLACPQGRWELEFAGTDKDGVSSHHVDRHWMPELGRDAAGKLANVLLARNGTPLAERPLVGSFHRPAFRRVVEPCHRQPVHLARVTPPTPCLVLMAWCCRILDLRAHPVLATNATTVRDCSGKPVNRGQFQERTATGG